MDNAYAVIMAGGRGERFWPLSTEARPKQMLSLVGGTPLVAMNSGSVRVNSHYQGGRQVYVNGDDGITYYYAHMSRWASGLSTGQRVNKGQVIGYVGDSGNARGTPHLHLGMIVGGRYVNPYPTVRAAC